MTTDWRQHIATFARQYGLLHDPATHALDLVSEVGEVAKEILLATDYGQSPPQFFCPELAGEIGDALYSLLMLAEACGVDADDALSATLQKYERRLTDYGSTGSA
ncbi:MAG: nucleotide pyrophosphohydrolase [Anaerolineae bacterium]|nr:nucleotide pyrophosphohydrolase [Anaerolineae bacterium]